MVDYMRRLWVSKGGAFIAFLVYVLMIMVVTLFKINFYELSSELAFLLAPGAYFIAVPTGTILWMGLPLVTHLLSLTIYMAVGYTIDWFYKPSR